MAKLVTNAQLNKGTNAASYTPNALSEVIVTDVILNDRHEFWSRLGGWDSLGTIFYKHVSERNIGYDLSTPNKFSARPFFSNQKYYPLLGERVIIFNAITKDVLADGDGNKTTAYYLPNLNVWNHPHHNMLPERITYNNPSNTNKTTNKVNQFKKTEGGVVLRQTSQEDASPPLGGYFNEDALIKPLLPFEGDYIVEGRFGNSIRFGATTPYDESEESTQHIYNPWSFGSLNGVSKTHPNGKGKVGDPIIIIRNEQAPPRNLIDDPTEQDKKGWVPSVEDINRDGSSIYITSNQVVPIEVAGSSRKSDPFIKDDSYKGDKEPMTTNWDLAGNKALEVIQTIDNTIDAIGDFISDPLEFLAPSTEEVTTYYEEEYDDGDNDFSFADELLANGADEDDIEDYYVTYENVEVSGTELTVAEQAAEEEMELTESAAGAGQPNKKSYEPYVRDASGATILENYKQYNQWEKEWKAGTVSYPVLYKNPKSGGIDCLIDPKPIEELIKTLKAEGVNGTTFPERKYLCMHVSAASYRTQHELCHDFWSRPWSRSGYHISVDPDGLANYNVDLRAGNSNGVGKTAFHKNTIGGLYIANNNTINISWIGDNDCPDECADVKLAGGKASKIKGISITKAQAYSYLRLAEYFMEAFPNITLIGHNQITISGGYGKSCPCWNVIEMAKHWKGGKYKDRVWSKHIIDYTNEEKKQMFGFSSIKSEGKLQKEKGTFLSNFMSYKTKFEYIRAAQYVVVLAGGKVKENSILG